MTDAAVRKGFREQLIWVIATLGVGLAVIVATWGAGTPKLSPGDPGPWGLPIACGVLLIICAVAELIRQWRLRLVELRGNEEAWVSAPPEEVISEVEVEVEVDADADADSAGLPIDSGETARLTLGDWLTIAAIGIYCFMIPRLGFTLSTIVLVPILLARFGATWSLIRSILIGVALVIFIKLIFGSIFGVQLPELLG